MTPAEMLTAIYEAEPCEQHAQQFPQWSEAIKIVVKLGQDCPECLARALEPIMREKDREITMLKLVIADEERGTDA